VQSLCANDEHNVAFERPGGIDEQVFANAVNPAASIHDAS
jgi:hypothetical protein